MLVCISTVSNLRADVRPIQRLRREVNITFFINGKMFTLLMLTGKNPEKNHSLDGRVKPTEKGMKNPEINT